MSFTCENTTFHQKPHTNYLIMCHIMPHNMCLRKISQYRGVPRPYIVKTNLMMSSLRITECSLLKSFKLPALSGDPCRTTIPDSAGNLNF
jgi:hypothetical protein